MAMEQGAQRFGLIRVGGCLLGLDAARVREVIHCPAALAPLPGGGAPELRGAVDVRGAIVPVLDPAPLLGLPAAQPAPQRVILLLRLGEAGAPLLLGLLLDGVGSIVAPGAPPQALQREPGAALAQGAALLTHAFALDQAAGQEAGQEAGLVALLDPLALARLPGVPLVAEPARALAAARGDAGGTLAPRLLFDVGGHGLAIAAELVETTVPRAPLLDSELRGAQCLGVVHHQGLEIPVLDTLQLLGLGRSAVGELSDVLVLRLAEGRVALLLDLVRDICQPAAAELLPLPALGLGRPEVFAGLLARGKGEGGSGAPVLCLDSAALRAEPSLVALAGLCHPIPPARRAAGPAQEGAPPAARGAGAAQQQQPVLTYRVESELGTPLHQVREILRLPAERGVPASAEPGMLGLLLHRGQALPLVCLRSVLGLAVPPAPLEGSMVLVVDTDEGDQAGGSAACVGWVVDGLTGIEPARWRREEQAVGAAEPLSLRALVELGGEGGAPRRMLPLLDLRALLRQQRERVAGP